MRATAVAVCLALLGGASAFAPSSSAAAAAVAAASAARVRGPVVAQLFTRPPDGKKPAAKRKNAGLGSDVRGVVKPTNRPAPEAEKELSLKELLTEYGVIAILFHFSVWVTSLLTVYTLLGVGLSAEGLPEWLSFLSSQASDADGAGAAAGVGARVASTLGVVEAIGPARLALTVTATPAVSERAREFAVVRDVEAWAERTWDDVFGGRE